MILGTSSNVGKSIITTGICRILSNRSIKTAPFKSQNMSRNSVRLPDGSEIAIAQEIQAKAARAEPTPLMNPILLKPADTTSSEVYLLGQLHESRNARSYYTQTSFYLEKALDAYHELAACYDEIIIEGAGGAAEINLYDKDIANILLARNIRPPILLVADIEKGGVFAQIYGTLALLPDDIRPLVKGIIINKFRGDTSLFDEGRTMIEKLTGIPVLGVIPFINHGIEEEDSLTTGKTGPAPAGDLFDALASHLETHLDTETLLKIIEESVQS